MTIETKNRIGKYGFVIFFFLLGGYVTWAYWPAKKPAHQWDAARHHDHAATQTAGAARPEPTAAEHAEWQQRMQDWQKQQQDQMAAYFHAKTEADRNAALDAAIDEMLQRRQEFEARRAAETPATQPGAATQPSNRGGWGRNGGQRDIAEIRQHIANHIDNANPQRSAMFQAYRQAMQQRMQQRGITTGGGGGGGFRGR